MDREGSEGCLQDCFEQGMELHRKGELTNAEEQYRRVLDIDPDHADALQLMGVVAAQLGNLPLAVERARLAISKHPDQPVTYNNLGNMLVELDRFDEAIDAYRNAIHLRPDYAHAHQNLGHVFCRVDQLLDALQAYQRSTELEPENADAWDSLGDSMHKIGRAEEAIDAFRRAIELAPERVPIMHRLGVALRSLNRIDEAAAVYRRCLELRPDDPIADHFLHVCEKDAPTPERVSREFVEKTFDEFAESFDTVLSDLQYRVPEMLGEMATDYAEQRGATDLDVVDLGCGTGLCVEPLRAISDRLIGVDLSEKMLAKAEKRGGYDDLVREELTSFLEARIDEFDLAFSADTLMYIGDLRPTLAAAATAVRAEGGLIFSLEKLDGDAATQDGYALNVAGRFQHDRETIVRWLDEAGFEVRAIREEELRDEGREGVMGYLVEAIRKNDSE
ncbi:MAG: tetratricopeptide repeat protein [Planctomycetota bacterium]